MKTIVHVLMSFVFIFVISAILSPIAKGDTVDIRVKLDQLSEEMDSAIKNGDDDKIIELANERKKVHEIERELIQLDEKISKAVADGDDDKLIELATRRKAIDQSLGNAYKLSGDIREENKENFLTDGGLEITRLLAKREDEVIKEAVYESTKLGKLVAEYESKRDEIRAEVAKQLDKEIEALKSKYASISAGEAAEEDAVEDKDIRPGTLQYKKVGVNGKPLSTYKWYTGFKPQFGFFKPQARVYFDTGSDDKKEVDIFDDGAITPAIDLMQVYFPYEFPDSIVGEEKKLPKKWLWGPTFGIGLSAPAGNSDDGSNKSSNAPVVMLSGGLMLRFPVSDKSSIDLEGGYAHGFSADEGLDDSNDGAAFMGIGINLW